MKYSIRILYCLWLTTLCFTTTAQEYNENESGLPTVRSVPDSVTDRLKNDKEFLYANDPSFWKKEESKDNSALVRLIESIAHSPLLKWSLYLFLAIIIGFVLYQVIVVNNLFIFSRSGKKKKTKQEEGEELIPDNLDSRIDEAMREGEYRLAIRYYYLKTLQLLHDRNMIRLDAKATNQDYIQQMRKFDGASQFNDLTRIYEYVWYGEYNPDESQFDAIRSGFNQFILKS